MKRVKAGVRTGQGACTRSGVRPGLDPCVLTALAVMAMAGCASPTVQTAPTPARSPSADVVVLDPLDGIGAWSAAPATGVEMRLSADGGVSGGALRVDFDFRGGGGWAAFRRAVRVRLPENYRSPLDRPVRAASVDGRAVQVEGAAVRLDHWPSRVLLRY